MNGEVHFVPKCTDPQNVSKVRPMEYFGTNLAQRRYSGGWIAMNDEQSGDRIKGKSEKVDVRVVQTRIQGVHRKLRKI